MVVAGPSFSQFENYVINALANIEHKLATQNQLLQKLVTSRTVREDHSNSFNFKFPLQNLKTLNEFEKLLENSKHFNALVSVV